METAFNFLWTTEFWFLIGVLFLIIEVLSVSFYFLFFGVGALLTALAVKLGWASEQWVQFTIFAVTSIGSMLAFRNVALSMFGNQKTAYQGDFVGERAKVTRAIAPNQPGKVSYRGTEWAAESGEEIEVGASVTITEMRGMTLVVQA